MTGDHLKALMGLQAATPVLIALYDPHDRLRYANEAFRSAYHVGEDEAPTWAEIMRRNHAAGRGTVLKTDDLEAWIAATVHRRGKVPFRTVETDLHDGRWLWMTETVDQKGWMLCIAVDITDVRAGERKLRQDRDFALRASQVDELTSVPNRRYTMERLNEFIRNCAENPHMWGCVAIIDIDYFKVINDRYGHHRGDEVLLDFARQMQEFVRRSDCFGRIGGEEFMLILPDTTWAKRISSSTGCWTRSATPGRSRTYRSSSTPVRWGLLSIARATASATSIHARTRRFTSPSVKGAIASSVIRCPDQTVSSARIRPLRELPM